jgi:acetate kinase
MDVFEVLSQVEVLRDFEPDSLAQLAKASRLESFVSSQTVLERGAQVDSVWVVASGEVRVELTTGSAVSIPALELFGEISLLTGDPAAARVVASCPSVLVRIPHAAITSEMSLQPAAAKRLARLLASRLAGRSQGHMSEPPHGPAMDELLGAPILVLNLGSSSIKYALFVDKKKKASGLVDRIGLPSSKIRHDGPQGRHEETTDVSNHSVGLRHVLKLLTDPDKGALARLEDLGAVGHRVVHGGPHLTTATLVDEAVIAELERVSVLAPLHGPVNLLGMTLCRSLLPADIPQVAVFDTAFHMSMPEHAYRYALPRGFCDERMLRRFGFHGTSHSYVATAACAALGHGPDSLRVVTCHLGNGASVAAVSHGKSVDTSMGLTPLEGLVMGTRSGDVDAGLVIHLLRGGMTHGEVDKLLNKESGLLGLSGRVERHARARAGRRRPVAQRALIAHRQAFCYRVRKYIGAYLAAMGGIDALVFTGGIGQGSAGVRSLALQGLRCMGIHLDERRNREADGFAGVCRISTDDSPVAVLIVPADEERMIARETLRALGRSYLTRVLEAQRLEPIPVEVSAHHIHLSQGHVEALFGPGHRLTRHSDLSQPGQFACREQVTIVGPKDRIERVRVLGPARRATQVEISMTEQFKLGIHPPIRESGDLQGTPGCTLEGPAGSVALDQGVICALRHVHMTPEDALRYGVKDKSTVRVRIHGDRELIFGDVRVRVDPNFKLAMHIDTDEANGAEVVPNMYGTIDSIQKRA